MTSLIERIEAATGPDNALDVLIECALFVPSDRWLSCRANNAGTKLICVSSDGHEVAFRAFDHTQNQENRDNAVAALRAREASHEA